VGYGGTEEELADLIKKGGGHLDMPAWKGTLNEVELATLAAYVVEAQPNPAGADLFGRHCASCHGDKIPKAPDLDSAKKIISSGGAHITMPVWGDVLTAEQLDALVKYTFEASRGGGMTTAASLYAENCADCHGPAGQGGPNPTRPGDIIAPISSSEYLKTRDDNTIRRIISQGQPDFGMSPFGSENGGPLDDEQLDALVAFIRGWEANPPTDQAPVVAETEVQAPPPSLTGAQLFAIACASCHGARGEGGVGTAFNTGEFQTANSDQVLFDTISNGHQATPMVAWGDNLSAEQIELLVRYIRTLDPDYAASLSYSGRVQEIFESNCRNCHKPQRSRGGWDGTTYEAAMTSGDNGPVVLPGNAKDSILARSILGQDSLMPPLEPLPQSDIQVILDWIAAGAPEK
jgi:mono/diheme cytochrome c family protein